MEPARRHFVKVIHDDNRENIAGRYAVRFIASGLASGLYFYRLTAGDFLEVRKLVGLR